MILRSLLLAASILASCKSAVCKDEVSTPPLSIVNLTNKTTTVYIAFGADSSIQSSSWSFCTASSSLDCSFDLQPNVPFDLPTNGAYLNATFSFGSPVTCGVTKAEVNLNNPSWYDIVDVSLVDGYSNSISIDINGVTIVPNTPDAGNTETLGVFPMGCDLCVARSADTPCGMTPGTVGCKSGSQYDPTVPCQYQGNTMGGGSTVVISLRN